MQQIPHANMGMIAGAVAIRRRFACCARRDDRVERVEQQIKIVAAIRPDLHGMGIFFIVPGEPFRDTASGAAD